MSATRTTTPARARQLANLKRGGQPGRRAGVPNRATLEIRDVARSLVAAPAYVESLRRRLAAGRAPHMEVLLHHYAYGKPKTDLTGLEGTHVVISWLSVEDGTDG